MTTIFRRNFLRLSLIGSVGVAAGCRAEAAAPSSAGTPAVGGAPAPTAASNTIAFDKPIYWEGDRRLAEWLQNVKTESGSAFSPAIVAPRLVEMANEVETKVSAPFNGATDRSIKRVMLYDPESLVKIKFIAAFSPKVVKASVTTTIKMLKSSQLSAIVENNLGEKWLGTSKAIEVGAGGCAAGAEPSRELPNDVLRVKFQDSGDLVQFDARLHHPMISGYRMEGDVVKKVYEPLYVKQLLLAYKGETVADIELTPGLSENPTFSFLTPRLGSDPLSVTAVNNEGKKFNLNVLIPAKG